MNYNFSYKRFHASETVFGACPCMWQIVSIKEQTCTLLIILGHNGRKLALKPLTLALKRPLYFSPVYCSSPADYTILVYMMTTSV